MKERPILFNAPMVRALLDGTKTQTQRVLTTRPDCAHPNKADLPGMRQIMRTCPYGQPGDRLWVREAWHYRYSSSTPAANQFLHGIRYQADGTCRELGPMPMDGIGLPKQRERRPDESWQEREDYLSAYWRRWRPSIHMPRWVSRITLEITGVRVERLQDISVSDYIAEGCHGGDHGDRYAAVEQYRALWESINGPGSWDANPWVWVVEFRRVEGGAA